MMTNDQAYIVGISAGAIIEALGMLSENLQSLQNGEAIPYSDTAFNTLVESKGLHHNAILSNLSKE